MPSVKAPRGGKMPNSPILAPQGGIKGVGKFNALGIYTGGLGPTVVKPVPGLPDRRIAPVALRGAPGGKLK